jgi:hypothetical protein
VEACSKKFNFQACPVFSGYVGVRLGWVILGINKSKMFGSVEACSKMYNFSGRLNLSMELQS